MPRNEEGEFELVLGNKQLLSVFFIVVVLLGVFFTMGYIVGRNSSPAAVSQIASADQTAATSPARPAVVEPEPRPSPAGEPVPDRAAAAPVEQPPETAAAPSTAPPVSKPVETPPPAKTTSAEPAPGQTFLQVAAVKKPEAELLAEVLAKKGFQARTAPVPGEDLFRVLVGPLPDAASLSKTRSDLEAAGFKSFPRKY